MPTLEPLLQVDSDRAAAGFNIARKGAEYHCSVLLEVDLSELSEKAMLFRSHLRTLTQVQTLEIEIVSDTM